MLEILISFLKIGVSSIGGGYATIPLIQQQIVSLHHWLTLQEFSDIITISQMTPGPLAVNASTFVGMKVAGIPGALIATIGCVSVGFIVSLVMYKIFIKYRHHRYIQVTMQSLKATSIGLITVALITILSLSFFTVGNVNIKAIIIFIIVFIILYKYKSSPVIIMLISGVLGMLLYV